MKRCGMVMIGALLTAAPATGAPLLSAEDLHGYLDLRASAADGETSWLGGGLGKTPADGRGGAVHGQAELARAMIAWTPHLNWDLGLVLVGQVQPQGGRGPALGEGYLKWRPTPRGPLRISARAGLLYPPVSLEHDASPFWVDRDMITPSAINSWIGEEVKVMAFEATISRTWGEQQLSLTGGIFGFNDTAGTLLTFRGWALGDVLVGAPDRYRLPPLSRFMSYVQAPRTNPVFELDNRPGAYARLAWTPVSTLAVSGVYYDNGGAIGPVTSGQWSWRTRFGDVGVRYDPDLTNHVTAQVMTGQTRFGFKSGKVVADTSFRAAYLRATHDLGGDSVSARVDLFDTTNHANITYGDTNEHGWSIGADYRKRLSDQADLLFEALRVHSNRPARQTLEGVAPSQGQTVLQASLRLRL